MTGQQIASEMDLDINDLALAIEGDFNHAAFAGEEDGRTGLQDIEVTIKVDADADEETLQAWAERVETCCPVSDNIKNETSVAFSVVPNPSTVKIVNNRRYPCSFLLSEPKWGSQSWPNSPTAQSGPG